MTNHKENDRALAERLVAARKAKNINQEAAATYLGISRPTFIAIEKGNRPPKPEELIALASFYGTTLNQLLRQGLAPPKIAPHFRAFVGHGEDDTGVRDAIAKLTSMVDDYQFLEEQNSAQGVLNAPPRLGRPLGSIENFAEHCAEEERNRLGMGPHEPISSLRDTLEDVGVHVFMDGLDSKLAGLYAFVENFGYCVLINRKHPRERRRWTIAHEYGHFLFDRDKPGIDYLQPMQRKPESERFADSFAEAFLMPKAGIERRFYDIVNRNKDFNVGDLCRIADFYAVSLMAMTLRLEALKLIPKNSWDSIKSAGVAVKELQKEAGINETEKKAVEMFPKRYIMLAVQAWSSDLITTAQLAKLLRRSPIEAREIALSRSQTSVDSDGSREHFSISLTDSLFAPQANTSA